MRITNFVFFAVLLGLLAITGCTKTQKGDINLRIKLKYGDQPFEMFKEFAYPVTKEPFSMTRLSFYISDMGITSGSNVSIIKDIDYLDLTNSFTAPVKNDGFEYKISGIPAGQYNNISFGIGVPKLLNAKTPSDFSSKEVLSSSAEYWASWKSYIFFRPEGKIYLNGSGGDLSYFALHLGGDDAYRSITLDKSFTILENETTNIDITFDVEKFFNGKSLYDIHDTQQIHALSQKPLINILADNVVTAFK
jgi:hypothetical protein